MHNALLKAALVAMLLLPQILFGAKQPQYKLTSPNGKTTLIIFAGKRLQWSVAHSNEVIVNPSTIGITLQGGEVLGTNANPVSAKTEQVNQVQKSPFYKKSSVNNHYNQLIISFKSNYGIIFRAYDHGVAYRFFTRRKDSLTIVNEEVAYKIAKDAPAFVPYVNSSRSDAFEHSYETAYRHVNLSGIKTDSLLYLPFLFSTQNGGRAVITEVDLEDYPSLYLRRKAGDSIELASEFPPYPTGEKQGGYNMTQSRVIQRAKYIAKTAGNREFPWRAMAIADADKDLLNNDLVYLLAEPSRVKDISWIKPGKVAWDWWNDWNLSHVNFKAGINTQTYKYYIDFAAANKLEYVMLDEGWAKKGDIMEIVPEIDLQKIIDYGRQKNVGIWLWGGMFPVNARMDEAFARYSKMGVKGFKIDFINRDDQRMMQFYYRAAQIAAKHHLMLDFHGACKPTGLMRTYPNVLNYEGVYGLEMAKFPTKVDFPEHAASIPFIRMLAGAMDYTPGAMRNAVKSSFYPLVSSPMSQGTRCQQLAMYVLFEAPFQMLSDSPTQYEKEKESTEFIATVPTVFDQTVALAGEVGKFAAIARKSSNTWYAGALTNWTARDLVIDLSFLGDGKYKAEIFKDGINADKDAQDYHKETVVVTSSTQIKIHLAPGGGWAAKFIRQ